MELSTLEWLKLNNNELRSLPYTLMEPVLMSLKYIDVYSECHGITIYMLDLDILKGNLLKSEKEIHTSTVYIRLKGPNACKF